MATGARVSIRPSALGGKGALLFCALELAFLATDYSNLFFLTLSFSAVLGALGSWWAYSNLRGLELVRCELPAAAADSARQVRVTLRTPHRTAFDLSIECKLGDGAIECAHLPLLRGAGEAVGTLPPQRRGVAAVPYLRVVSRHPFGLLTARIELPTAVGTELLTYPTPSAPDREQRAAAQHAEAGRPRAGRGPTLVGLREFRDGDSVASIHWKATARRGAPMVKESEYECGGERLIVLDRRCSEATLEARLGHATAAVLATKQAAPLHLHSQQCMLVVDDARGGAQTALRWLATASTLPMDAEPPRVDDTQQVLA